MNTVINTNMAAIRTHGVYNKNNTAMNAAMTKVATGLKINSAQDNASGYAITAKMRERIRVLDQANQNTQNDTAMMKTAEGALANTVSILTTLRERAIDAANDSNTDTDRAKIQAEVKELLKQVDTNADVKYNGKTLLDGSVANKQETKTVLFSSTEDAKIGDKVTGAVTNGYQYRLKFNVGGSTTASYGDVVTTNANSKISDILTGTGITKQILSAAGAITGATDENGDAVSASSAGLAIVASNGGLAGAITGLEIQESRDSGSSWTATSALGSFEQKIAAGDAVSGKALNFRIGEELDVEVSLGSMKSAALGIGSIDVSTKDGAKAAVGLLDTALETALKQQTKIGAYEQRLGYASDNLTTARENVEASASTIADSDIAKEMTNYMRYAVLSQASQYMLAQAGQNAFQVLNLLQQ